MTQPEPPVDPPSDTETPVDHLKVALTRLADVKRELSEADIPDKKRALMAVFAGALENEIAMLR